MLGQSLVISDFMRKACQIRIFWFLIGLLPFAAMAQVQVVVEISGLDTEYETNVRLNLGIERQKSSELLTAAQLKRLFKKSDLEISKALEPYGYYHPLIDSRLIDEGDNQWRAIFKIESGPPVIIDRFDFKIEGEIRTDPDFVTLLDSASPETGKRFSHIEYERFKSSLVAIATERGYFDATFSTHQVAIDRNAKTASIEMSYDSGPRYRFGEIRFDQNALDDSLLQRFASFQRGDPYDLDQLLSFQQALNDTRYFQVVEVYPGEAHEQTQEIPIQVRLTQRSRHHYKIGLGYGTDTGARAKFGWEMPRINAEGHHFDSEFGVSEIGHKIIANYRIPVLDPRTDQLVFTASEEKEAFETGDSTRSGLGISLVHSRAKWRETLSLEYQEEDFSIDGVEDTSELLIPGVSWVRTWGPDFINVLDGVRLDFILRGADEDFASNTSFEQYGINIKFITSLTPRDRLLLRGGAGTIETDEFERIPSSIRYYAGGTNSVRGYAYQSLGPTDDDGDAIGARRLLVGSIEYEHFYNDRWGLAVFLDAGNAIDDFDDDVEQGAGFGWRWRSPVGLIRVDLANSISADRDWRLHFNIGPDL
ncbi:MAG: autotransporter assembly complex family protein [Pseudomonadota bacterium]